MNARQRRKARRAAKSKSYEELLASISLKVSPGADAWIDWVPVDAELAAVGPRADLPDDPDTPPGLPPRLPDGPVPPPPGEAPQAPPPCCPPGDEADEDRDDEEERAAAVVSLIRGTGLAVEDQLELLDAHFIKGASLAAVADRAANLRAIRRPSATLPAGRS